MHTYDHCNNIYNSQILKQTKHPPVDEQIRKLWHIYTLKYYSATKNNEILSFATTWMDLEGVMLSEISHTLKGKYRMISPICGIQKAKETNKTETNSQIKITF